MAPIPLNSPWGGATAASPFVGKNIGRLPCIQGWHVQDCIAEGKWGHEIFTFWHALAHLGQTSAFQRILSRNFSLGGSGPRSCVLGCALGCALARLGALLRAWALVGDQNQGLEAPKSRPRGSKIEPRGLQNRARSPPKRNF